MRLAAKAASSGSVIAWRTPSKSASASKAGQGSLPELDFSHFFMVVVGEHFAFLHIVV